MHCVIVIKYAAFFTIWTKLTVAFTCTNLLLNLYTSVSACVCGFGFEQNFWRINGFGTKKAWIGGFAYPYSPPSYQIRVISLYKDFKTKVVMWFSFSHWTKHELPAGDQI